ncbi:VanZ family protein [Halobacillus locisalis]|uniref:VanZ family protein n=1 Tax=Halobacillus locisalis TaxID=220753 RepID=A0A838CS73_9BACI|nr:VanZ family protein [Halobacillus locisalis]MBA2174713.1 VanZ family protein [Halobacillus locisalis]
MNKSLIIALILSQSVFWVLFPWLSTITNYLHPLALFVINMAIFFIAVIVTAIVQRVKYVIHAYWFHIIFLLYMGALLILLFIRPGDPGLRQANFVPFDTIQIYLSGNVDSLISMYNLWANVGLFLPLGVYFAFFMYRWSVKWLLPFGVIGCIEVGQFVSNRGSLDIDDLILNMVGVWLGYGVAPLLKRIFVVKERHNQ